MEVKVMRKKKLERKSLEETFNAVISAINPRKKAYYDGRKLNFGSFKYEDFAKRTLSLLDDVEFRNDYYNTKSNVEKIAMVVKDPWRAFALTYRLSDSCIIMKEMMTKILGLK